MKIEISTKKRTVPVEFTDLDLAFEIELTDDNLIKIEDFMENSKKVEENYGDDLDSLMNYVADGLDTLLGEGAFDDLYEHIPSTLELLNVLITISTQFSEYAIKELGLDKKKPQTQQEAAQKYIQNRQQRRSLKRAK